MADILDHSLNVSIHDDTNVSQTLEIDDTGRASVSLKTSSGKVTANNEGGGIISIDTNVRSGKIRLYDSLGNETRITNDRLLTNVIYDPSIVTTFGDLTTTQPFTLFQFDFVHGLAILNDIFSTSTATGATISASPDNIPGITLSVTGSTGSQAIVQSNEYFYHQKGKEQRVLWACQAGSGITGIRKREGYFDGNDGLFFENNGTNYSINVRNSIVGSSTITVSRGSWEDPLDGTGPSGLNIDFTKFLLKYIRFSWFGTNMVQFGVVVNQKLVPCHTLYFNGTLNYPFIRTPHLPLRFELVNIGSATGSTLTPVSGSVLSMGGCEESYVVRSVDNGNFTQRNSGENRLLIAIRLRSAFNRAKVRILRFHSSTYTNGAYRYIIWRNPTFTGTPVWVSAGTNSFVEYAIHNSNTEPFVTGGIPLWADSLSINNNVSNKTDNFIDVPLNSNISGTSDIIAFTVNGNANGLQFASAQWKEIKG